MEVFLLFAFISYHKFHFGYREERRNVAPMPFIPSCSALYHSVAANWHCLADEVAVSCQYIGTALLQFADTACPNGIQ